MVVQDCVYWIEQGKINNPWRQNKRECSEYNPNACIARDYFARKGEILKFYIREVFRCDLKFHFI